MSFSYSRRISSISYFSRAIRSRPTPNAKPVYSFRIDAAHLQYVGMYHTAAQDLDPAAALAETAALTAALEAANVHLRTGLCEREMMRTELCLCLRTEQLFCKLCQGTLQICKGDILIDNQTLDLMEGRRMGCIHFVGTEYTSRARSYGSAACPAP